MKKMLHYYINKQPCQIRLAIISINSNEPFYYSYVVSINKYGGSCNTIEDPYGRICVPDKVKNMNVKICNVKGNWNNIFSSTWIVWG